MLKTKGSDDIDLAAWAMLFFRRRYVILLSVLAAGVFAGVYILITNPVYRAETHLLPPRIKDLQELLIVGAMIDGVGYTPEAAYAEFLGSLSSKGFRGEFFDRHDLGAYYAAGEVASPEEAENVLFDVFNRSLQISVEKSNPSAVTIGLLGPDPVRTAQLLNQFVEEADKYTIQRIVADAQAKIETEKLLVKEKISGKLNIARQKREDDITRLQEALAIARALDVAESPVEFSISSGGNRIESAGVAPSNLLYMRGEKALAKEIEVLKSRKSESPFVEGLPDLRERFDHLSGISVDAGNLVVVTVDQFAITPVVPEKPKSIKLMVFAVLLGLIAGGCLVIIGEFVSNLRQLKKADD